MSFNLSIPKIGTPFLDENGRVNKEWFLFLAGMLQILGGPMVIQNVSPLLPVNISLTTGIVGILGVTNGGTGISGTSAESLLYSPSANTVSSLNIGPNSILVSDALGGPVWSSQIPSTSVGYIQAGSTLSRTVQSKNRDIVSLSDFASGNGAQEQAAIQNAFNEALSLGAALYVTDGKNFNVGTGVTVNGVVDLIGTGTLSTTQNVPAVTYNVNSVSINGWMINGPEFVGPTSSSVSSCAIRFTGDSAAFVQYGYVNCYANGFNAFLKDEKVARTTPNGLEGMLNWNGYNVRLLSPSTYGFWYTQGSGTGNRYSGQIVTLNSGAAAFFFDGNGCVVGDLIHNGLQLGCQAGSGGIAVKIGDNTKYRAQFDFTGLQCDAGVDTPISMSVTGAVPYTNITLGMNNLGGNTNLGSGLQPLRNSNITDRDASIWNAGNFKTTNSTGSVVTNVFQANFASWGAANFRVYANGLTAGVAANTGYGEYDISEGSGSLTVLTVTTRSVASGFAISVTTSGTVATVKVTCSPGSVNTYFNASLFASGNDFKVTRL